MAIEDSILAALDPDQRAVALATRGPLCVIAGAGTGKTRAITHRIAYAAAIGTMDPQKVLALTLLQKLLVKCVPDFAHLACRPLPPALFTPPP